MNQVFVISLYLIVAPACASESSPFTTTEFDQYCTMRTLANVVFDAANIINNDPKSIITINFWNDQRENSKVNSRYDRTEQGLFLEFYEDLPLSIRTPWGKWSFNTHRTLTWKDMNHSPTMQQQMNAAQKILLSELSKKIGLEFNENLTLKNKYGPVFKVTNVCGRNLPEAIQTPWIKNGQP